MRRRRTLDDRSAEALLSGRPVDGEPELTAFVAALSAEAVAAAPSAALSALLTDGFVPAPSTAPIVLPRRPRTGVRRWAMQVSLGAAACVAVSAGAAANDLPAPVQTTVADVVEALTPLTVPRPAEHPRPQGPTAPGTDAEPTDDATDTPTDRASDDPSEGPDDRTGAEPSERADDGRRGSGDDRGEQRGDDRSPTAATDDDRRETPRPRVTPSQTEQPDSHEGSGTSGGDGSSGGSGSDDRDGSTGG